MQLYHTVGLYQRVESQRRYFLFIFLELYFWFHWVYLYSINRLPFVNMYCIKGSGLGLLRMAGEVAAWSEKEGTISFVELLIVEGGERHILALSNNGFFFTVTSSCSNFLLCTLISARLLQQQRHLRVSSDQSLSRPSDASLLCVWSHAR